MFSLQVGDIAPTFTTKDHNDNTVSLEDFKGKTIILYFYPKDDTPGCTAEACNLRDNYSTLTKHGFAVIGVSTDSPKSHDEFKTKYNLPFTLIADTDKAVSKAYDIFGPKRFMGRTYDGIHRTTFIINKKGFIQHIITKVDTTNHTAQILSLL